MRWLIVICRWGSLSRKMNNLFKSIIGEQLGSVEFVQDYLHLHFDGPAIQYYIWPTVIIDGKLYNIQDLGYRDAICTIIANKVQSVNFVQNESLTLHFYNNSKIYLSLVRDEVNDDVIEFIYYTGVDGEWFVLD